VRPFFLGWLALQFCQPGATDLSVLRSVLGASSDYGTDLALPGQWHPRDDLGLLLNVGANRETFLRTVIKYGEPFSAKEGSPSLERQYLYNKDTCHTRRKMR
jgi:hypothetical protein